ncbi:hypothetical protein [Kitasatospora sp. GAS1066B]
MSESLMGEWAEDAWLDRLADEAEDEGREGSITLDEMAELLIAEQV